VPPTKQSLSELPLPPAIYLILLALNDGEAHGYRIRTAVIERSGGLVTLDPGSLYRRIARLVDDGVIAESLAPHAEDDERRRYYRLTPLGRRLFAAETERMATLVGAARAMAKRPKPA
jgi:DNA-binding PadR family transcriptional regulator